MGKAMETLAIRARPKKRLLENNILLVVLLSKI